MTAKKSKGAPAPAVPTNGGRLSRANQMRPTRQDTVVHKARNWMSNIEIKADDKPWLFCPVGTQQTIDHIMEQMGPFADRGVVQNAVTDLVGKLLNLRLTRKIYLNSVILSVSGSELRYTINYNYASRDRFDTTVNSYAQRIRPEEAHEIIDRIVARSVELKVPRSARRSFYIELPELRLGDVDMPTIQSNSYNEVVQRAFSVIYDFLIADEHNVLKVGGEEITLEQVNGFIEEIRERDDDPDNDEDEDDDDEEVEECDCGHAPHRCTC